MSSASARLRSPAIRGLGGRVSDDLLTFRHNRATAAVLQYVPAILRLLGFSQTNHRVAEIPFPGDSRVAG